MEVFTWSRKLTKLTVVPVLVAIIVSVLLGVSIKFGELTVADMWRRWAPAAIDPAFNSWCLPARIRMEFSGHWKGLTLWGHLPVDGKVHGEAHVIRNASASLIYFRYGVAPDVIQEQWSVWREGGRHVTIGRNTTVAAGPLGLLDGAAESACFTLEDAPATASNDPSFCRKTNEVQFQFSRYVPFGSEQLEEWSIRRVRRMPNSTLSILFKRLPADNPEPFESSRGASVLLPVWHEYGDTANSYYVDHAIYNVTPDADDGVFLRMPDPATCRPADAGIPMQPGMSAEQDVQARARCPFYASRKTTAAAVFSHAHGQRVHPSGKESAGGQHLEAV